MFHFTKPTSFVFISSFSILCSIAWAEETQPNNKVNLRLNRKEFETAIQPYFKEWGQCYDKALKDNDQLVQGEIILKLALENGHVVEADTHLGKNSIPKDTTQSLYKCVLDVAKTMKNLPAPKDRDGKRHPEVRVQIRYPLEFSPNIDVSSGVNSSKGAELNAQQVQRAFELNRFEMGHCYMRSYRKKKQLPQGRMLVQFEVQNGKVTKTPTVVESSPSLDDSQFTSCIVEVIEKIKFPTSAAPSGKTVEGQITTITYPLNFGKK